MKNIEIKNSGPADLSASESWRMAIQSVSEGESLFIPKKFGLVFHLQTGRRLTPKPRPRKWLLLHTQDVN